MLLQIFALCAMANLLLLQGFALRNRVQLQINCVPLGQSESSNFLQHVITIITARQLTNQIAETMHSM